MPILLQTSITPSQVKQSSDLRQRHLSTGRRGSRPGVNVSPRCRHYFTHLLLQAQPSSRRFAFTLLCLHTLFCLHVVLSSRFASTRLHLSPWRELFDLLPTSLHLFTTVFVVFTHSLTQKSCQPRRFLAVHPGGEVRVRTTTGWQLVGLRRNASRPSTPSAGACDARRSAVGTSVGRGVCSVWAWFSGSFGSSLLLVWWWEYCSGRGSFTGGESAHKVFGQFCFYH